MSALTVPIHDVQPLPAGPVDDEAQWIPASEAATLLGLSVGQMNRRCAQLEAEGMATKAASPDGGGQRRWHVARRYHPALEPPRERDATAERVPDAFLLLPKPQQRDAWKRVACVKALRQFKQTATGAMVAQLPILVARLKAEHGIKVSKSSLYRWDDAYRKPADILKLVDTRGGDQKSIGDPAAWSFFRSLFLDRNKPKKKKCYDLTRVKAEAERWEWPSYPSVCRRLDEMIPPEVQMRYRDRKRWLATMQPTIEQDPEAWSAGTLWEGDHAELDLICRYGDRLVRPWLTAWMDWRTRRVVGYTLSIAPNASTIQSSFKMAMLDPANRGGPDTVRIDNGKDYKSRLLHGQTHKQREAVALQRGYLDEPVFEGIFGMLDIDVIFTIPRGPNGKSRMERWFGTMHDQFERDFASYTGRNAVERPDGHADVMRSRRQVPTFERVADDLREYIAAYNASADHQRRDTADADGVLMSPDEAMIEWGRDRRSADPETLDMILGQEWPGTVTVGRNGITIRPFGVPVSYGAFDPRLTPYKARLRKDRPELVISYDPHDASRIRVWTAGFRKFVGVFKENEKGGGLGANRDNARELIQQKRSYAKSLQIVKDDSSRGFMTPAERLRSNAARKRRDAQGDPPPRDNNGALKGPIRLIQTPVDGQAKRIQAAEAAAAATGTHGDRRGITDLRELVKRAASRDAGSSHRASSVHVDLSDLEGDA